jgi:hypothetical protein
MPVQAGYGTQSVDFLVCLDGLFIGIEAKQPNGTTTPRQDATLAAIKAAGGSTFVVRDGRDLDVLEQFLESVVKWGST